MRALYGAFAKLVAPAKEVYFSLQMSNKHLALSVSFSVEKVSNRTRQSYKTLAARRGHSFRKKNFNLL